MRIPWTLAALALPVFAFADSPAVPTAGPAAVTVAAVSVATAMATPLPSPAATAIATPLPSPAATAVVSSPETGTAAVTAPATAPATPSANERAPAEAAPAALSPSAGDAAKPPKVLSRAEWSQHGVVYRFNLGQVSLYNGNPLSYSPLELGWRFDNGVWALTGIELFYYDGYDNDPTIGRTLFTYSMQDWHSTLAYKVPLPLLIQPIVGVSVDMVWGSRQWSVVQPGQTNNSSSAPGGIGPGAMLGLQYRGGPNYAVGLEGRYSLLLGAPAAMTALELNWAYLF